MPTSVPHTPRMHPRALLALLTAVLLAAVLLTAPIPAVGQSTTVHSPRPAPHAVLDVGRQVVGAVATGGAVEIAVDGEVVPTVEPDELGRTLAEVDLTPGAHEIEVRVDGRVERRWPVLATGVKATTVPADPLAVASAAGPTSGRLVVLADPAAGPRSLAAGPLAAGLGAVLLPTDSGSLPATTGEALAALHDPGRAGDVTVLLLGGQDIISDAVADRLRAAGHPVERVGAGGAAEIAAAAATRSAYVGVYRRGGDHVLRQVVIGPASPLPAALQAAAEATRRGASLLLADEAGIDAETDRVLRSRRTIRLADGLSPIAVEQIRRSAGADATVTAVPPVGPIDHAWLVDPAHPSAVMAVRAARPATGDRSVVGLVTDVADAEQLVARTPPRRVTVVGPSPSTDLVRAWSVDGPVAPSVRVEVDGSPPVVSLRSPGVAQAHAVHVEVDGREWPGTTAVAEGAVTWTPGPRPALVSELDVARLALLRVTAVVAVDGAQRHVTAEAAVTINPLAGQSAEGFAVAGGTSDVVGTGPLRTFTIEVEPSTELDLDAVTAEATAILLDPGRGWTARGDRSMQRIADPAAADIRVVVARPATVDAFCGRVGLNTAGRLSCWDGRRAMLNLTRWQTGVAPFHTDLTTYRQYLVNHEVGHGLGFRHVGCPASGAPAPVMMQQSKSLGSCTANGWPFPNG